MNVEGLVFFTLILVVAKEVMYSAAFISLIARMSKQEISAAGRFVHATFLSIVASTLVISFCAISLWYLTHK